MPRSSACRRGFSLRDLTITLVMLVAVLAFVLPMMRDIRRTEQSTACLINLRENGLATLAYTQENDGLFPPFGFEVSVDGQGEMRVDVVKRGMKQSGLDQYLPDNLLCPSDGDRGELCIGSGKKSSEKTTVSYGYNIDLIARPRTLESLRTPATSAVLYDGSMAGGCGRGKDVRGVYQGPFAFAQHASDARHGGQINLVYADWHTVSVESMSRPTIELGEMRESLPD